MIVRDENRFNAKLIYDYFRIFDLRVIILRYCNDKNKQNKLNSLNDRCFIFSA